MAKGERVQHTARERLWFGVLARLSLAMATLLACADVVIMTREGLDELVAEGRIVAGSEVDLARTLIGVGVRSGAPRPEISTVEAFKRALLQAKTVAMPGSTTGIYMKTDLLPRLGIADSTTVTMTARGAESAAMVAAGKADLAVQPVSELVHVPGIDFVSAIPVEVQHELMFSADVVAGSTQRHAARRLIAFLASEKASSARRESGMEPPAKR